MGPGQEIRLAPPIFEPGVIRKQMYSTKESICNIVGIFGALRRYPAPPEEIRRFYSDSAPDELCPLAPLVTRLYVSKQLVSDKTALSIPTFFDHRPIFFECLKNIMSIFRS